MCEIWWPLGDCIQWLPFEWSLTVVFAIHRLTIQNNKRSFISVAYEQAPTEWERKKILFSLSSARFARPLLIFLLSRSPFTVSISTLHLSSPSALIRCENGKFPKRSLTWGIWKRRLCLQGITREQKTFWKQNFSKTMVSRMHDNHVMSLREAPCEQNTFYRFFELKDFLNH